MKEESDIINEQKYIDIYNEYFYDDNHICLIECKGTNLYIYGQIIEMPNEYYDKMKILVRYYEVE